MERFRHSREVFVSSGIFGTVLGFYFGAGESKVSQLGIDATLADTTLGGVRDRGTSSQKITVTYGPRGLTKTQTFRPG